MSIQKITPFLWYAKEAEDAAKHYAALFPNSRITRVASLPAESPSGPPESVKVVEFELCGQAFTAMSAPQMDAFNHAISFTVNCDTQEEIDHYWNGLLEGGGQPQACGWLKDRFGVSWQITPTIMGQYMADPDRTRARRAAEAMLKMVKFDIAALKAAYEGR